MSDATSEKFNSRELADEIRALRSQTDLILQTMRNNIDHLNRDGHLARDAETFVRNILQSPPFADARRLEHYGYNVFSQNGEDGMIQEIFNRIGAKSRRFIEFGVQDGRQCNTHFLLYLGWSGMWVEGDPTFFPMLKENFGQAIELSRLTVKEGYITVENINEVFTTAGFAGDIDLLSVDVDGLDWYFLHTLTVVKPRVIVVEYNSAFRPPIHWVMPYNKDHRWDDSLWFGASLTAFTEMLAERNYALVGTDICGVNAFYVHRDDLKDHFAQVGDAGALYNPPRYQLGKCFPLAHRAPAKWRSSEPT